MESARLDDLGRLWPPEAAQKRKQTGPYTHGPATHAIEACEASDMRMHARARAPVATRRKRVAVAAALALRWYRGRPPCPRAGRAASAAGSSTTDKERAATIHPGLLLLLNHHAAHASLSQGLHLCEASPPCVPRAAACSPPVPLAVAHPLSFPASVLLVLRVAPRGLRAAAVAGIRVGFPSTCDGS
jgi:hypothetical protein